VEPKIKDNSADITYIYNNALTSLQGQILSTVSNAFNASEVIIAINNTLTTFQTNLSSLTTKEASDVSSLQGQINSNYTTIDNKYSQLVTNLAATKQDYNHK
jgi:prophage DNA circulation protein